MTLLEAIETVMYDEDFEGCIYSEHGGAYWELRHLRDVILYGDSEDDEVEYETTEKGDIHILKDDGELGRKVYRNLGDRVKFFTKLAKDEVKENGGEVDEDLLQKIANEVEVDLDDDDDIAAILKKCKPRKKK